MRILMTATILVLLPSAVIADDDFGTFSKRVRKDIQRLEEEFVTFEKEPTYRRVKTCKEIVRALLISVDSEDKGRVLSEAFCTSMARSDRFQFYEYYILWLGRGVILQQAGDKDVLLTLAAKIDARERIDMDDEVRNELCAFAVESLKKMVSYPGKQRIILPELEMDWDEWDRFSAWIANNHTELVFDNKQKVFYLPPEREPPRMTAMSGTPRVGFHARLLRLRGCRSSVVCPHRRSRCRKSWGAR